MGWTILAAVVAGCADRGGSADDDSVPVDDNLRRDDTGGADGSPIPLTSATSWVDCNWASVPASPIGSVAVGTDGVWFASASQVYTLDVLTHTLIKDQDSPKGTRALWADADDNVYTMSSTSIAMRPEGGAWTPLREEKGRSLIGVTGNDFGVWFGTSDGSVLRLDDDGEWAEEDVTDGELRAMYGRAGDLWVATATAIYRRSPDGSWEIETEIAASDTEVFDEIRGNGSEVWAVVAESGLVLQRARSGTWSAAGPEGAVDAVHLWNQQATWYASDGIGTWALDGDQWIAATGPEALFVPKAIVSNGTVAYALGGGDVIARSETPGVWELVIATPWESIYDAIVVGDNLFAAGRMGLYPNEAGLVRYVSDGFWVEELQGATVRALLSPDDMQLWAAGAGGVWHMNGDWQWSPDLTEPGYDFRGLAAGTDGAILAVASDGTFFERQDIGAWTPETTGAVSLAAVIADGDDVWAVGEGIFRRDPVAGWVDESPGDAASASFFDIEIAVDANGNRIGLWAVGRAGGLPAIYSRTADGLWVVEPGAPQFSDATAGVIATMYVDAANSIWLLGEHVTANGDHSFVMHSQSNGWVGEEPGGAGVSRRMIWMSDRRWVFGDAIDVRPRAVEGCF